MSSTDPPPPGAPPERPPGPTPERPPGPPPEPQAEPPQEPPKEPAPTGPRGAFRITRVFGITVWLHWSWLLVAAVEIQLRRDTYSSLVWNVAEYLALFGIVLLHEFGHALACRSVGGRAEHIQLWPLGGVAYVAPPPRPGAHLWSIAAGPLVNVALLPLTVLAVMGTSISGLSPDAAQLVVSIGLINAVLLVFNLLPVYPLDGGQILRSLLWFVLGAERSLGIAAGLGLVVCSVGAVAALSAGQWWLALVAGFGALSSWRALRAARARLQLLGGPRHEGVACPACHEGAVAGAYWTCGQCGEGHDPVEGACTQCGTLSERWPCALCGAPNERRDWFPEAT